MVFVLFGGVNAVYDMQRTDECNNIVGQITELYSYLIYTVLPGGELDAHH